MGFVSNILASAIRTMRPGQAMIKPSPFRPVRPPMPEERKDYGIWQNALTGLGTPTRDKSVHTNMSGSFALNPETCADLYHGDGLAAIVADALPEEALRRDIILVGEDADHFQTMLENVRFVDRIQEAAALGRAMGGAIAILGIDDGGNRELPIRPTKNPIEWVDVFDRRALGIGKYGTDPRSQLAGQAEVFEVTPASGTPFKVHRSRCLVFGGVRTAERERAENDGWDWSIYDRIYNALRAVSEGQQSLGHLLADASQAVFKIHGLLAALAMPGGQAEMSKRGLLLDLFRGITRSILLDAGSGEEYDRHTTNFSGIPDSIDRQMNFLCAVTRTPVTVLTGQTPEGLNATGESELQLWYDRTEVYCNREIKPAYIQTLAALSAKCVPRFPKLRTSAMKKADADLAKTVAETDKSYREIDVLMPEDIAEARFPETGDPRRPTVPASRYRIVLGQVPDEIKPASSEPVPVESKVVLTPSTQEVIVSVNQGLAALGLPGMGPAGEIKIAELKAAQASTIAAVAAAESGTDPNAPPPVVPPAASSPPQPPVQEPAGAPAPA